jgi:predicted O-methyltransferase YrrM
MIPHEQYISELIQNENPQSYLEIGIGTGKHFASVPIEDKEFADPEHNMTSDEFFQANNRKFDLIFIDGLHHAEQVERDILNAWNACNIGGHILVHDILPENEDMTIVPRAQKEWTGDVYKAWLSLLRKYGEKFTIRTETGVKYGLGVIVKTRHKIELFLNEELTYQDYEASNIHGRN